MHRVQRGCSDFERVKQMYNLRAKDVHYACPYDGLPCCRFIDGVGFSACYVKDSHGKLVDVCSRFAVKPNMSIIEDYVHKDLIPK